MGAKYLISILAILLLVSSVSAHHIENLGSPGVGPGLFWGIDRALESIKLFFTFDKEAKVELRLKYAAERLAEANAEFKDGYTADGEAALRKHKKLIEKATAQLEKVEDAEMIDELYKKLQTQVGALGEFESKTSEIDNSLDVTLILLEDVLEKRGSDAEADTDDHADEDTDADEDTSDDADQVDDEDTDADDSPITGAVITPANEINVTDDSSDDVDDVDLNITDDANSTTADNTTDDAGVALDMEVKVVISDSGTEVVVTGDYETNFSLDIADEDEIKEAVAAELGLSMNEVEDIITIVNNIGKPEIYVSEQGGEIVRVTVTQDGIETKFVLGIIDEDATVREIRKRTDINESVIRDVMVWVVE